MARYPVWEGRSQSVKASAPQMPIVPTEKHGHHITPIMNPKFRCSLQLFYQLERLSMVPPALQLRSNWTFLFTRSVRDLDTYWVLGTLGAGMSGEQLRGMPSMTVVAGVVTGTARAGARGGTDVLDHGVRDGRVPCPISGELITPHSQRPLGL